MDWTKKEALDELRGGGYGFHTLYTNIPEYVNKVDIAKMKKRIGLEQK